MMKTKMKWLKTLTSHFPHGYFFYCCLDFFFYSCLNNFFSIFKHFSSISPHRHVTTAPRAPPPRAPSPTPPTAPGQSWSGQPRGWSSPPLGPLWNPPCLLPPVPGLLYGIYWKPLNHDELNVIKILQGKAVAFNCFYIFKK